MADYVLEADGGSRGNPGTAGSGAVVITFDGEILAEIGTFLGTETNNFAEYTGLITGLEWIHAHDPEARIEIRMDSKLVIEQMSGRWKIKHPNLKPLAAQAQELLKKHTHRLQWIPREKNSRADEIANRVMDTQADLLRVY